MKYWLFVLISLTIFFNLRGNSDNNTQRRLTHADSMQSDTLQNNFNADTNVIITEIDSLSKAYSIILHHLRIRNEELEAALLKNGRITAFLVAFLLICLLIILFTLSRKKLFASFPNYRQRKGYQPGLICLQMLYKYYYGRKISYKKVLKLSSLENKEQAMSLEDLSNAAEKTGLDCKVFKADLGMLYNEIRFPAIVYFPNHMAVLYGIKNDHFYLSDPYHGYIKLNTYYFATSWFTDNKNLKGIVLQLFPLKTARKSLRKKLDLERFSKLKSMDKRYWKDYICEIEFNQ